MTSWENILLIDDDPRFADMFCEVLASEGYAVAVAANSAEALRRLDESGWDLVLLDRKLHGPAGPDAGLDLIGELRRRAPDTKIILMTGYADAESVKRAFDAGVYDYLEKNQYFEAILKVKVRNALEAARERRIAALANGRREETIAALWRETMNEEDPQRKGRKLEDLMLVIFKSIPGFERAAADVRSIDEQIDLIVPNESPDAFWQKEPSQYLLVECKNWSSPIGPSEVDRFQRDLERRHERCALGFLVALGGFSAGVRTTLATARKERAMVVLLGPEEVRELVEAGSGEERSQRLKEWHRRSVVTG